MGSQNPLQPSAVSESISQSGCKTATEALPHEILHNLQYQHGWTDLRIHAITSDISSTITDTSTSPSLASSPKTDGGCLISGLPPRHSYVHPDFQAHLIKHDLTEHDIDVQREWVLPTSTGESWTLKRFCHVFDDLPARDPLHGISGFTHQDAKRVLCGMKANDGSGGDGTVVYYIMQEGEVKPRQN